VADRLGDLGGGLGDLCWSSVRSNERLRLSLCLPLAQVMRGSSHHSLGYSHSSVVRSSMGHSDGSSGSHTSGHHLAVVTHHLPGQDGLGGGLLAGGGDHLLAVLSVHSVHDLVILLVADLARSLHVPGGALELWHRVTLRGGHCHWLVTVQHLRISLSVSLSLSFDGSGGQAEGEGQG